LAAMSGDTIERAVTLPPGCARLATDHARVKLKRLYPQFE